jgi:hypothetical protein
MNPETRRLYIQRRDLRSGSIFDCLFGLAMIISITVTLVLSVSSNCQLLQSRFAFCIPCDNRLVIWGIFAAPMYTALMVIRFTMFQRLNSEDLTQVEVLLVSSLYRYWRVIHVLISAWTMLGAIWYLNQTECNEASDYQLLMYFVNILFWISICKYVLIMLVWIILFCMMRLCPNHPVVVRLFGSMAQPFADSVRTFEAGLTAEQLSMFPSFKLPQPEGSPNFISVEDRECAICLCPYEDDQPLKRLFCRHHYHSACIDQWLSTKSTCPLCNSNVLSHVILPSSPVSTDSASPIVEEVFDGGTSSNTGVPDAAGAIVFEHRVRLQQQSHAVSSHLSSPELTIYFDG